MALRLLLITGCYRSGTTLAEKLVNSHPQVIVASQPFPVLYFAAKETFLEERHLESRYPLGHLFGETRYTPRDLSGFLDTHLFDRRFITRVFDGLDEFTKGLWTPEILRFRHRVNPGTFSELFTQLLGLVGEIFPKKDATFLGAKEVLVEEIAEHLGDRGVKIVFVVRDPRDMITSLNFRDRDNLTGDNRPVLFSVRAWRKSVALALRAEALGNGTLVRYEDLTLRPAETMEQVTNFLEISALPEVTFQQPIRDQWGRIWGGNSSFEDKRGISTGSVGTFRRKMPEDVIRYVESCCLPEMWLLGYEPELTKELDVRAVESFRSPFPSIHEKFPEDYSSDPLRIADEIRRYELLKEGDAGLKPADVQRWFLRATAYERLRDTISRAPAGSRKHPRFP